MLAMAVVPEAPEVVAKGGAGETKSDTVPQDGF